MIEWKPRVVASGLLFPEGPAILADGSLAFTDIRGGTVSRVVDGAASVLARTGGGPNGLAASRDGALFVANNGGLSVGPEGYWHAQQPITGRVQRVGPDGSVAEVAVSFPAPHPHRPNDLAFGPDGMLYVTDPANWEDLANLMPGRIWRVDPATGAAEQVAEIPSFVNGIAFGPDGRLYAARSIGMDVVVVEPGGSFGVHARLETGFPDGMCFASNGDLIVCGSMGHVIRVFDAGGALKQSIETGPDTEPTNCCLADGILYVTLSGTGDVVAVDVDLAPLRLHG